MSDTAFAETLKCSDNDLNVSDIGLSANAHS